MWCIWQTMILWYLLLSFPHHLFCALHQSTPLRRCFFGQAYNRFSHKEPHLWSTTILRCWSQHVEHKNYFTFQKLRYASLGISNNMLAPNDTFFDLLYLYFLNLAGEFSLHSYITWTIHNIPITVKTTKAFTAYNTVSPFCFFSISNIWTSIFQKVNEPGCAWVFLLLETSEYL